MPSKVEQVIQAVETLLGGITAPTVSVERGGSRPETIEKEAHLILLDGEPEPDGPLLGNQGPFYYIHRIEVEVFVEERVDATRRSRFDAALQAIEARFETDPTLGGLIKAFDMQRPEPVEEGEQGSPTIKAASLPIFVEYQSDTRL